MPIPKIETPKYKCILPSDGKEITYRPFLVKEEKILLIAQESKDTQTIAEAMVQIINNCTFDQIDGSELSQLDFQYQNSFHQSTCHGQIIFFSCQQCHEPY